MGSGTNCWRVGRVRSLSLRWPRIAEVTLQELKSAGQFVLCTRAGVSERLAHDEWGGLLFLRRGIFCVQKMVRNDRWRSNRGTALRSTNDCCLLGKCRSGLRAYISLDLARGCCTYLLAKISMIEGIKCLWPSGGSNRLALMPEGP